VKVVIFGASGMVGQGVLRECLLDPDVESVLAVVRNASLPHHDKLREIVHQDVSDLTAIEIGYQATTHVSSASDHLAERKVVSDDKEIADVTTCSFSVRVCVPALPQ
jgi:putative NADH-flavin reductase